MSEKLQAAREYENLNRTKADEVRPMFHATGGIGWINDPNGFSTYQGEYHLFCQYHPYDTNWGPMHWGHLKTKDFVCWERLPIAIAPDEEYDKDGCYSGSAIELLDGKQLLLYTGVKKVASEGGETEEFQTQCVAIGDGIDYVKYTDNPVIAGDKLPKGAALNDFRDPKIWREGDTYYAVVGNRISDGSGAVLLFQSKDALHWEFVTILARCNHEYGIMWECPDFFLLDGKRVMIVSPTDMMADGYEFHAGHGVVAFTGKWDGKNAEFCRESVQALDYGLDFYAPQTLQAYDGRRIMIAWMRNWANTALRKPGEPIYGSMTLPRELTIKNGRIYQNPVREIEKYRTNPVTIKAKIGEEAVAIKGICGRYFDMTVTVQPTVEKSYRQFKILLAKDEKHQAQIRFGYEDGLICIDRSMTGVRTDMVHARIFESGIKNGTLKLRIIMDRDSVELFINDGERAATFMVYSPETADGICFMAEGEAMIEVEKYDIFVPHNG